MTTFRIDYTLKDGRKRRCYVEAIPGTPLVAILSKAGVYESEGMKIRKVSEVKKIS